MLDGDLYNNNIYLVLSALNSFCDNVCSKGSVLSNGIIRAGIRCAERCLTESQCADRGKGVSSYLVGKGDTY